MINRKTHGNWIYRSVTALMFDADSIYRSVASPRLEITTSGLYRSVTALRFDVDSMTPRLLDLLTC